MSCHCSFSLHLTKPGATVPFFSESQRFILYAGGMDNFRAGKTKSWAPPESQSTVLTLGIQRLINFYIRIVPALTTTPVSA